MPLLARGGISAEWVTKAPIPIRTQELYPVVHKGKLYVAGGIAARFGVPYFTDRCFAYDPGADKWDETYSLPEDLHHVALMSTGDDLLAIGGFNGGIGHVWRMRSHVYRLTEDGWVGTTDLPQPQAEGVVAYRPASGIHLVTGQSPKGDANTERSDHSETADHWVFINDAWNPLAPIPTPRNSATGGWVEDQLVVAGGRTRRGNLAVTEIYDPSNDSWRSAAPMPLPQAGTAGVVTGKRLIVFGGEIFSPQARVFPNVWQYNLEADSWSPLPNLPTPRHGLGAGLIGNAIYVVGGAEEPGGSATSDANEQLTIEKS